MTPPRKFRRETLWPLVLAGSITLCSGFPASVPEMGWLEVDKLGHLVAYGTLATAILRHPRCWCRPVAGAWVAALLASAYGLGDEYRQAWGGVRMFEWADWVADTVGAVVAAGLYLRWAAYRKLLETPVVRRRTKSGAVQDIDAGWPQKAQEAQK
jgi:VanZ family protein